jgi:hypothetical protein
VYLTIGDNETQSQYAQKKRLLFNQMIRIETSPPKNDCFSHYPPFYGQIYIASDNEYLLHTTEHVNNVTHSSVQLMDNNAISFPLVYHYEQVAKVLIFLRDKTKENAPIDWDSVKK